jgi:ketosteroid isomerase-like protein
MRRIDDPVLQVREMWDAWFRGGVDAMLAWVDEDVEWTPHAGRGRVLHGSEELRAYWTEVSLRGERHEPTLYGIERHGDCVVATGALRVVGNGRLTETQLAWVLSFEDGRLRTATAYSTRAEALRATERSHAEPV